MSTAPAINHPSYHADYQALRDQLSPGSPAWLNDLRAAAWDSFDARGFPTARRGNEPWKYTNVRPIARGQFSVPRSPGDGPALLLVGADGAPNVGDFLKNDWTRLVFLDGQPLIGQQPDTPMVSTVGKALATELSCGVESVIGFKEKSIEICVYIYIFICI